MATENFQNDKSVLRDCTSTQNYTSLGSSRRMSLGSYTSPSPGGDVDKDRRQLLEEWRRQKRAATPQENRPPCDPALSKSQDEIFIKRPRIEYMSTPSKSQGTPTVVPLHPDTSTSHHSSNTTDTSSVVERMRMRRLQRPPLSQEDTHMLPPHPPSEPTKRAGICFDDDDSPTKPGVSASKSAISTPSSTRRYSMASGAKRITRGRMSMGVTTTQHTGGLNFFLFMTFSSGFIEDEAFDRFPSLICKKITRMLK